MEGILELIKDKWLTLLIVFVVLAIVIIGPYTPKALFGVPEKKNAEKKEIR